MRKVLITKFVKLYQMYIATKHNNKRKAQNYEVLKYISLNAIKCALELKSIAR